MQLHLKMKKQTMSDNSEEKHEYLTQNLRPRGSIEVTKKKPYSKSPNCMKVDILIAVRILYSIKKTSTLDSHRAQIFSRLKSPLGHVTPLIKKWYRLIRTWLMAWNMKLLMRMKLNLILTR